MPTVRSIQPYGANPLPVRTKDHVRVLHVNFDNDEGYACNIVGPEGYPGLCGDLRR